MDTDGHGFFNCGTRIFAPPLSTIGGEGQGEGVPENRTKSAIPLHKTKTPKVLHPSAQGCDKGTTLSPRPGSPRLSSALEKGAGERRPYLLCNIEPVPRHGH